MKETNNIQKSPKRTESVKFLIRISFIILLLTLARFISEIENLIDLYKTYYADGHPHFNGLVVKQFFLIAGNLCVPTLFLLMMLNLRKGFVFRKENYRLLYIFGFVILIIQVVGIRILRHREDVFGNEGFRYLLLISFILLFMATVFKIGIKLQEEQELTI